ncbi:MAG TPA: hypothetical protein VEA69_22310 [Tepidisphaeraceae bacterium]|nr:hypothetical protein [Tepidisphaeraceae bacterium]
MRAHLPRGSKVVRPHVPSARRLAVLAALAVLSPLTAGAAVVTSARDTTSSETWSTAGIWSNNAAPSAGNDYIATHVIRTASGEFAGASLTFNGGTLALKQSSQSEANLTVNGGSISNFYMDSATQTLSGNLATSGTIGLSAGSSTGRITQIAAALSGTATFNVNSSGAGTQLRLTSATNANAGFTGTWNVQTGVMDAQTVLSLGNFAALNITGGSFDADYDINTATGTLSLTGGAMTLDQNHSFAAVTINGDALAPGTYTFADLNTAYDARFADGGTGAITVAVPEPAAASVLVVSAFAVVGRRSARRRTR